ncbi:MAG: DUF3160 domain-containing protein [Candidatus Pacebacteria bacterium]|nr:DUF3160 domain-containing protein [Candidatus Paceibacterota bacterium]
MASNELADYIKESRRVGQSDTQIKEDLKNNGWQQIDIDQAFSSSGSFSLKNKKVVLGTVGLAAIVALVFLLPQFFRKNTDSPTPTPVLGENNSETGITPSYVEISPSVKDIPNYSAVAQKYGLNLTPNQEKSLDQNRFLLVDLDKTKLSAPKYNFDQMLNDFDSLGGGYILDRKPEDTKLVTPDIVLHAYHKYFELTLEQLEKGDLSKDLGDFLIGLHSNLALAVKNNTGLIKERYQNLESQIVLARVIFENKNAPSPDFFSNPDEESGYFEKDKTVDTAQNAKKILVKYSSDLTPDLVSKIQYDIDRIYSATDVGVSPLFGQYSDEVKTDYTQFTPRSHYTKSSALRAYFRTMMYLGRSSYFISKDIGIIDSNLLVKQFSIKSSTGIVPLDLWKKIMSVTGFYAGQSDDLTYTEWADYKNVTIGGSVSDSDLSSTANIKKLADNLVALRMPKILSDVVVDPDIASKTKADLLRGSMAFRIFGQRFTFDAWVLGSLTSGQESSDPKLPSTPSSLFISAALGDLRAKEYTKQFLQKDAGFSATDIDSFVGKLEQTKADIRKVKKNEWFASMGSAWLYVLGSLTHTFGAGYPGYMQASSFLDKQIQTFLGSFTELKHDTLLYAKQNYAEMGGGGDDERPTPPIAKGFVEPNVEFWNKFNELLDNTEQVFRQNNLFKDSSVVARLQSFREISDFYTSIAKKELQNQQITDDEYEKLRTTTLSFMVQPFDSSASDPDKDSGKVALIADVHTDAVKGQILYQATGKPYLMLALVGNENSPRVVVSLVYNHYELNGPIGKRLTDEDWKDWVYNQLDKLPAKNFWYQSLLVK